MRSMKRGLGMLWGGLLTACLLSGPMPGYADDAQAAPAAAPTADSVESIPAFLRDLGLSPEQMAKLRQERLQTRKERIKIQADVKILQVDLQEELARANPDQGKVDQIAKQLGAAEVRMVKVKAGHAVFLRSVLTPEQQEKFDARMLQLEDQGGPRGGWRMHHRGGGGDAPEEGPDGPR